MGGGLGFKALAALRGAGFRVGCTAFGGEWVLGVLGGGGGGRSV